jgi:hypothetical protein
MGSVAFDAPPRSLASLSLWSRHHLLPRLLSTPLQWFNEVEMASAALSDWGSTGVPHSLLESLVHQKLAEKFAVRCRCGARACLTVHVCLYLCVSVLF